MRTIQQLTAKANGDVAASLARALLAMPEEKQVWSPLEEGRTALNMVAECAVINRFGARVLRERVVPPLDSESYAAEVADLDTADKAVEALHSSVEELGNAIESLPNDLLETNVQLPWDEQPSTLGEATLMAYWNMVYHLGQVNYVQTLYGDREMH